MSHAPRITVVTPSFNQGHFLKETIESVLDQQYPNLEYIIMDGGSTDESVEIIRRYERYLAYWNSEPDGGQSAAIREGFRRATGDVLAWLNSDDYYEPGVLKKIGTSFAENRDLIMVYGDYFVLDIDGSKKLKRKVSFDFDICLYAYLMIPQPSAFWRRDVYEQIGGLDPSLRYTMDYDLFLRLGAAFPSSRFRHLREPIATFRLHQDSKSVGQAEGFGLEAARVTSKHTTVHGRSLKVRKWYHLARVEWRFLTERGFLPLRKDKRKA